MQCAAALMERLRGLADVAGVLALAWVAAHAALLVLLALAWGLLMTGKVVLGWLAHTVVLVFLLAAGVLLALWLWPSRRRRAPRLPRPA